MTLTILKEHWPGIEDFITLEEADLNFGEVSQPSADGEQQLNEWPPIFDKEEDNYWRAVQDETGLTVHHG